MSNLNPKPNIEGFIRFACTWCSRYRFIYHKFHRDLIAVILVELDKPHPTRDKR